jgi:hypothetical protein
VKGGDNTEQNVTDDRCKDMNWFRILPSSEWKIIISWMLQTADVRILTVS